MAQSQPRGTTESQRTRESTNQTPSLTRVPVSGGVLVYRPDGIGRKLEGFEEVTDWDDLRDALAARGHDRGAVHHLPELDG